MSESNQSLCVINYSRMLEFLIQTLLCTFHMTFASLSTWILETMKMMTTVMMMMRATCTLAMELYFVCPGGHDQRWEVGTFKDHDKRFVNTVDDIV